MKQQLKDGLSRMRQLLGLPHDKTRSQIRRTKAAFDTQAIEAQRIALISRGTDLSPSIVEGFVLEADSQDPRAFPTPPKWDPGIMSRRDCTSLYALVRALRPQVCVETGAGAGCSSMHILAGLEQNQSGRLYSLELQGPFADRCGEVIPPSLRERWELRLQDHEPLLPQLLEDLHEIDLFVHDSNHTFRHMLWEYELAWRHLAPHGVLASHDVIYTTAFEDFTRTHQSEIGNGGTIGNFGFLVKESAEDYSRNTVCAHSEMGDEHLGLGQAASGDQRFCR